MNPPTNTDDFLVGNDNADYIDGLGGNDLILGAGGNDFLIGNNGNDTILAGDGIDHLDGGAGTDTVDYSKSTSAVYADLGLGHGWVIAQGQDSDIDYYKSIENVNGSAFNDQIVGNAKANLLVGLEGDDLLIGGAGADTIVGGSGVDVVLYDNSAAGVTVNLTTGVALNGDAQGDDLQGIENLFGSTGHGDVLTGDGLNNLLNGGYGSGDDVLSGLGGSDWLQGNTGADKLLGGSGGDWLLGGDGADMLDGGTGEDVADYVFSSLAVHVDLATGKGSGGEAAGDTLTGIENLLGSDHSDTLLGNDGGNYMEGGKGNDIMAGRGGLDSLLAGEGADSVSGGDGNDFLYGNAGDDKLDGGAGNDRITGDGGRDVLTGDSGKDTFAFNSILDTGAVPATRDLITDFAQGGDRVEFSSIDANTGVVGDQAFSFAGFNGFTHVAGELREFYSGANTVIAGDTDGDGNTDFQVEFAGHFTFDASDFIL